MGMTVEEAAVILKAMTIPALKAEHPLTARVIAAIPDDKVDYRPDGIVKSALDLAWHIVAAENRFFQAIINGAFDLTPVPRPETVGTAAAVNNWYSSRFDENLQRLQHLSGEQLIKRIDFRGLFQFPAIVYAQIGLNHSIHHRGQLSMYLRPMGAKVPSIYGESFDAREEREARERATVTTNS